MKKFSILTVGILLLCSCAKVDETENFDIDGPKVSKEVLQKINY